MKNKLDNGAAIAIAATFVLLAFAPLIKGIGKELLLEAGVLLVSIKLILMLLKNASESLAIREDLHRKRLLLQDLSARPRRREEAIAKG